MGADVVRTHRFEVRSCRTGHLEAVYETLEEAIAVARKFWGQLFFITDLDKPIVDRIVWTKGEIHQDAHRWLAMLGQLLRSTGLSPNSWEEN